MTFKTQFPELGPAQVKMLARMLIEGLPEVISKTKLGRHSYYKDGYNQALEHSAESIRNVLGVGENE